MIDLFEQIIQSNQSEGKPSQFKARIQEPNDPEFYYRQTVEGFKYGSLGIYEHEGLWYGIHVRSGRSLGIPLASADDARRLVFLVKGLAKWSKVDWKDDRAFEGDELYWLCTAASEYCNDLESDYGPLMAALSIQEGFAGAGGEMVIPSEPLELEPEVVEFGVAFT